MVNELAAGFPAGVEARLVRAALPVQRQQSKPLALIPRRLEAPCGDPMLEHLLADGQEFCCTSPTGLACASGAGTTPFQEYRYGPTLVRAIQRNPDRFELIAEQGKARLYRVRRDR